KRPNNQLSKWFILQTTFMLTILATSEADGSQAVKAVKPASSENHFRVTIQHERSRGVRYYAPPDHHHCQSTTARGDV
ncbi:MAG: hypothetical protein J0L63_13020, partial [Anaerolineae bacterium]|nr:hypothetical protein [Anaerolineae bacterium]